MLNRPSYEQFVRHNLGLHDGDRRDIIGVYKNSKTKKIIKGDNFSCISIQSNAEKSYKAALKYFNHTRYDKSNAERIFVSAKWKPKENLNTQS
ncbi:hypothetical protein LCGC14_2394980 [marine sediment metagenome]|uniref:Uncharacterized protein n=1 Tax=marine sediment metagenome TaxID=412755 RepID=A0A0F9BX47_9ZZZZ